MLKEISSEHRSIGEARKFLQEITTIISLLLSIGLLESKKKIKDSMPHADFIFIKHSYWKCLPCLQPRCYPLQNEKKKKTTTTNQESLSQHAARVPVLRESSVM